MGIKIIIKNSKAFYDYQIEETFEAGMVLAGTEVKSLREGKANITEAFVTIDGKFEAWIYNLNIPQYSHGNINNHEEGRKRKLLLKNEEISQIFHKLKTKGLTLIPLKLYFKDSYVKCEIALAKGKKLYDKRQDAAKKDVERKLRQGKYDS